MGSKEEPRTEDSYEPGEIVAYREEDLILRVRVLNNMCTDKAICYTLKVEKVINPHSFVKVVSGGEFKFFKEREFSAMGGLIGILGDP